MSCHCVQVVHLSTILILRHPHPAGVMLQEVGGGGSSSVISILSQWRNQRRRHFNRLSGAERTRAQRPVARIHPPVHVPTSARRKVSSGSDNGLFYFFSFNLRTAECFKLQWKPAMWISSSEMLLHGPLDSAS